MSREYLVKSCGSAEEILDSLEILELSRPILADDQLRCPMCRQGLHVIDNARLECGKCGDLCVEYTQI